jgi:hypothetical protein
VRRRTFITLLGGASREAVRGIGHWLENIAVTAVAARLPSSARRPKLMVVTELRKRLVISRWRE